MIVPTDPRTVAAVRASYLTTALDALRKVHALDVANGGAHAALAESAAVVRDELRSSETRFHQLRNAELASTALEA